MEIVSTIIMVGYLFFVLSGRVEYDVGDQSENYIFHQFDSHSEGGPIMTVLEEFEHVTCTLFRCQLQSRESRRERVESERTFDIDFTFKVSVVEHLHWDLVLTIIFLLE